MVDLGSRSGTRLNDVPVQTAEVQSGDLLAVGPHVFRLELLSDDAQAAPDVLGTMAVDDLSAQLMLKEFGSAITVWPSRLVRSRPKIIWTGCGITWKWSRNLHGQFRRPWTPML